MLFFATMIFSHGSMLGLGRLATKEMDKTRLETTELE